MKITITSIELKNYFKFFPLSLYAMRILKQLKAGDCVALKKRGSGRLHYTMSMWNTEEDLKNFARSGAHLDGMKNAMKIANAVSTYTYDGDEFPSWKEARELLEKNGRVVRYGK